MYLIKFDENGNRTQTFLVELLLQEQIKEKKEEGFIEVNEENFNLLLGNTADGVHVYKDGKFVPKPPYVPTAEELEARALAEAKAERADAVSKITVEVDGMVFDGDEEAQTRMGRTVAAAIALGVDLDTYTQTWVLADNTVATPTIKQLAQALKLAGEKQTELWTIPYEE